MIHLYTQASKYIMILLILMYSFECFHVFRFSEEKSREHIYIRQRLIIYLLHLIGNSVLYLRLEDSFTVLGLYIMELCVLLFLQLFYHRYYKMSSELVLNNMSILLVIGMIMLKRISMYYAQRQFLFIAVGAVCAVILPLLMASIPLFPKLTLLYAGVGLFALAWVAFRGDVSYGSRLSVEIFGFSVQLSEFVKIVFVFFLAGMLQKKHRFKQIFLTALPAALFVLLLVYSRDLGSALLYFFTFLMMVYAATNRWYYLLIGSGFLALGGAVGYRLFSHVQTRVLAWRDPLSVIEKEGFQVSQSLFGIGTGGWFGMGLTQGKPDAIPVVAKDYIFSAISEEMGLTFAICVILICVSCFLMIFNISMQIHEPFYKLASLGLGSVYALQIFLTIGGVIKFIPSTGVTLPFVSYGGSSMLSTMLLFGIIQGLYIRQYYQPHSKSTHNRSTHKETIRRGASS